MNIFSIPSSIFPNYVNVILSAGEALLAEEKSYSLNVLQLTPEQADQIKAIERRYSDRIHQFTQEIQQSEVEINGLMIGTESSDQVRQKERELEALKLQATPVYFEKFLAIREALTLPQLQRIQNNYLPPRI